MSAMKERRGKGLPRHDSRDCELAIDRERGRGWLTSGEREEGERVECPTCGTRWVHICDEAEGCLWVRSIRRHERKAKGRIGEEQ